MNLGLKKNEIKLVSYSEEWHHEFIRVKEEILRHMNLNDDQIEHIGSMSISKMSAKPIIDIVVGIDDITNIENDLIEGLNKVGFLRLRVERPDEVVFAKFTDETYHGKTHYIHLVNYGDELWSNLIFFRDYLNHNEEAREEYLQIKLDFIKNNSSGIKEYTDNKEEFVKAIYAKRKGLGQN